MAASHIVPYELARLRCFPGKRRTRPGPQPARPEAVPGPLPFSAKPRRPSGEDSRPNCAD